jgi:predicted Rossmann fold flavoprotein
MQKQTLIVIGGGAAGFFCAINAAVGNPNLKVIIAEKTTKVLTKVLVSGGGRCNVTHACYSITDMVKKYPRGEQFLKKAFGSFFTTDTINWFKNYGVDLKTEEDGRMFPTTNTSSTIANCLLQQATNNNIEILYNADVIAIETTNNFLLKLKNGNTLTADFVCVAAGGYSKIAQFSYLQALGHTIVPPVPSLFTFNLPKHAIAQLMGVVITTATAKISGSKFVQTGPLLITHWGLSGPCILKLSAFAALELAAKNYSYTVQINWLPNFNENTLRSFLQQFRVSNATQKVRNRNPLGLPNRFWEFMLQQTEINPEIRWADLPAKNQNLLVKALCSYEVAVNGKTTFKEEFVTAGGITLTEVDAQTLESRIVPNLFFAGEVLNIDGVTGGFNFQSAWTTGYIAGTTILNKCIHEKVS